MQCVSREIFYQRLDDLKQKQKRNTSQLTMFIEDQFYNEAMEYLKIQSEKSSSDLRETEGKLSQSQLKTLQRKKWTYHQRKLQTPDRKTVIPKSKLYDTLILAHQRTAHRGRQITSKWENDNYSEVSVRVVKLFISLCPFHKQQKTITSHVKVVTQYGKVNTLITPSRFYPCIATDVKLDFSTKTSFTAACKKAHKSAIDEKLLIGAKFPLYYSLKYLDMEKENKLLQDTNLKILFH